MEMDFNLKLAEDCARSFSEANGLGCMISTSGGKVIRSYGASCAECGICSAIGRGAEECQQAHTYGMHAAERLGGRYIYFCVMGLTCFTSPIIGPNGAAAKLTVGPFLMVDRQDYAEYDLAIGLQLKPEEIRRVMALVEKVPYVDAQRVTPLSQVLFLATSFLNDVSQAERMLSSEASSQIQNQISTYIHTLKGGDGEKTYPLQWERSLLSKVRRGDRKGAQEQLNRLLGYLFSHSGVNRYTKDRLADLLALLTRTVVSCGADAEKVLSLSDECRKKLSGAGGMDECSRLLSEAMGQMMEEAFRDNHMRHRQVVHSTIQYIQLNYQKKISLNDIAAYVSVSSSYLCRLFKREVGQSVMGFLTQLRIDKSKELLLSTDRDIVEIAMECGFEDQSYYTKVFKRLSDCTPHQYRKRAPVRQAEGQTE